MMAEPLLPAGFETLEPYVERWAIGTTAGRAAARTDSSRDERGAFYAAAVGRKADALALLDQTPLAAFSPPQQRLMDLMLAFAHVALAEEVQKEDEAKHSAGRAYMKITRSTADR